ncbi:DUF1214 domain-containing protein [Flammeovirga sp. SubArs3]|uniref:DUF1214 domain-containing protein n=1 Tax=Flammeovirga sp. SubArs3 TaxID=2995316 RepID=UPI00248C4A8B|nr:DUF1214 domain-containing protein [Flammeovirga sp. SubArs3]
MKINQFITVFISSILFLNYNKSQGQNDLEKSPCNYNTQSVEITNGVPSPHSSEQLFNAMDYYSATLLYMWALPSVGLKGWENANIDMGANSSLDGQISLYSGYEGVGGILTPTTAVTYAISFVNTDVHGPAVWEIPAGRTAGYVGDYWQRPILDVGVAGKDKGQGIKLLIVGPNQDVPDHDDSYTVIHSPTNVVWLGTRNMENREEDHHKVNNGFDSYPYFKPELAGRKKLRKDGKAYKQRQPHGMEYWNNLNVIIQREKMHKRDELFYGMLKNIGIEKGKPFQPDKQLTALLTEAERIGYQMAVNNTFKKRFEGAKYYDEKRWYTTLVQSPNQLSDTHGQLFERASYFHEAIGSTWAMKMTGPGPGSTYLSQYETSDGHGFDGGKNYKLVVPPHVPAKQFWAITIYDSEYRTLIENDQQKAELNSINGLKQNNDGSTTIFVGPSKPEGFENNWIQTSEGTNWFTYFRLYFPQQPFFDKTWQLNDFEEVD